jgi:hypothetical protein
MSTHAAPRGGETASCARILYVTAPIWSHCWAKEPAWRRFLEVLVACALGGRAPSEAVRGRACRPRQREAVRGGSRGEGAVWWERSGRTLLVVSKNVRRTRRHSRHRPARSCIEPHDFGSRPAAPRRSRCSGARAREALRVLPMTPVESRADGALQPAYAAGRLDHVVVHPGVDRRHHHLLA